MVIDRGKRSKTPNEVKLVKNINKFLHRLYEKMFHLITFSASTWNRFISNNVILIDFSQKHLSKKVYLNSKVTHFDILDQHFSIHS